MCCSCLFVVTAPVVRLLGTPSPEVEASTLSAVAALIRWPRGSSRPFVWACPFHLAVASLFIQALQAICVCFFFLCTCRGVLLCLYLSSWTVAFVWIHVFLVLCSRHTLYILAYHSDLIYKCFDLIQSRSLVAASPAQQFLGRTCIGRTWG